MNPQISIPSQPGSGVSRAPQKRIDPNNRWAGAAQMARALSGLRASNQFTADSLLNRRGSRFFLLDNPHPFKIYNVPALLITTPGEDDWLRFRVRSGQVGSLDVDGTDAVDNPDSDEVPFDGTGIDIPATSGAAHFFFWIELSGSVGSPVATIMFGEDPTANGWDAYPETDGRFILLGWIDTTDTTSKQVEVRQIIRTDIPKGIETADCGSGGESIVDYFGYRFDTPP